MAAKSARATASSKDLKSRFTVRVELHSAAAQGYSALDDAMEAVGFSRMIGPSDDPYLLPQAEYRILAKRTRAQVRDLVRKVAASLDAACSVLVTEGSCSWYNLPRPK